jgi:hypothetical protein
MTPAAGTSRRAPVAVLAAALIAVAVSGSACSHGSTPPAATTGKETAVPMTSATADQKTLTALRQHLRSTVDAWITRHDQHVTQQIPLGDAPTRCSMVDPDDPREQWEYSVQLYVDRPEAAQPTAQEMIDDLHAVGWTGTIAPLHGGGIEVFLGGPDGSVIHVGGVPDPPGWVTVIARSACTPGG